MPRIEMKTSRNLQSGQTLVIAVLIMGVLLVLGIAFSTIINRSVTETGRMARRTVASDLAKAGAEYAHNQLVNSALGADWRPAPTNIIFDVNGLSKDPDSLYLRPASGIVLEPDPVNRPGIFVTDRGGPDFLGPYTRVNFGKGRSLVRVRFAPQDYEAFVTSTGSSLRAPGQARSYIIIETVGRAGEIDDSGKIDPSQLLHRSVKVALYASAADLLQSLGEMKAVDATITSSRKQIAFASIGIIESARFITNKNQVNRPAEIGMPTAANPNGLWSSNQNLGVLNEGQELSVQRLLGQNGGVTPVPRATGKWDQFPGGGSFHANSQVMVYGDVSTVMNRYVGESISATGGFEPANDASSLTLSLFDYNPGIDSWQQTGTAVLTGANLDSSNGFNTVSGAIRDGVYENDQQGYSRAVPRKEPPSITVSDPNTGLNRYRILTAESNTFNANGQNIAEWGYGQGVFVDSTERGNRPMDKSRAQFDPSKSLPNDWLNPNNANSLGWQGQFYIPVAPYLKLLPDGFEIIRDSRSTKPFWLDPATGNSTAQSSLRYYVRKVGSETYIVDQLSNPGFNPLGATNAAFIANGRLFNGVLMFGGDVRVRGVIPTDIQLSVVAMGTIYVEGSITKGILEYNGATYVPIQRPSQSMIALMAQDYVAVNTTMFFGPAPGEQVRPKSGNPLPNTPNPVELDLSSNPDLFLQTEFLLNPNSNNPANWTSYAEQYAMPTGLPFGGAIPSNFMLTSSADDSGPTFLGVDIRPMATGQTGFIGDYLFAKDFVFGIGGSTSTLTYNAAAPFFPPAATNIPVYGLGDPAINAYPKFETIEMPIFAPGVAGFNGFNALTRSIDSVGAFGTYRIATQDSTLMHLRMNPVGPTATKNYLLAKAAVAPFDIRIEAVMFAENGSFFVIPGNWFNSNSDDTRLAFEQNYTPTDPSDDLDRNQIDYGGGPNLRDAQQKRYQAYGNTPAVPFYAEPIDVKISIVGAVSENMPAPMSQQAAWLKKWGWIPRRLGGTGLTIPDQHRPATVNFNLVSAVPNLQITYDPALATASVPQTAVSTTLIPVRTDIYGNTLPPLPRLPVSPNLAYFGDATP